MSLSYKQWTADNRKTPHWQEMISFHIISAFLSLLHKLRAFASVHNHRKAAVEGKCMRGIERHRVVNQLFAVSWWRYGWRSSCRYHHRILVKRRNMIVCQCRNERHKRVRAAAVESYTKHTLLPRMTTPLFAYDVKTMAAAIEFTHLPIRWHRDCRRKWSSTIAPLRRALFGIPS